MRVHHEIYRELFLTTGQMNLLKKLEQTKVRTSDYFELSEDELSRTYASGKWNIRFILHHLADTETILFDRIRRIISKPRQVIWDFDQDAWANSLNYEKRPLQLSSKLFTSTRAGIIYYAGLHYEKDGDLEFVHSRTGTRTLRQEFEKVAFHNQNHLDQIKQALSVAL